MVAIPERVAKTQHFYIGDKILAYSLKVASTFLYAHVLGHVNNRGDRYKVTRLGQAEALRAKENGTEVHLVVRHPLDRLVSNYVFWTKKANSYIKPINDASPADHSVIMGDTNPTIEQWYEASQRHYNAHWEPQWDYHTTPDGVLVPTHIWPIESLSLKLMRSEEGKNESPRRGTWEDYYSPEFRAAMEERYANDVRLYEQAKENWNGEKPTIH